MSPNPKAVVTGGAELFWCGWCQNYLSHHNHEKADGGIDMQPRIDLILARQSPSPGALIAERNRGEKGVER